MHLQQNEHLTVRLIACLSLLCLFILISSANGQEISNPDVVIEVSSSNIPSDDTGVS